jgi:hypothetical protein
MKKRAPVERDPLEAAIETALRPGQFIDWRMESTFTSDLHRIAAQIDQLVLTDPERAVRNYESFLTGSYEKAEEIDDDGYFGLFVEALYCGWLKARQATGADPDKTASLLLDRMENDPYGYAYQLEREAVKALVRKNQFYPATSRHSRAVLWPIFAPPRTPFQFRSALHLR